MVVFTCNHCGDTLQKPKVAKHYQFKCRKAPFVTCVDCLKDFRGDEYIAHTKCITEAERYGGKHYTPKPSANKGERKQQEWLCVVNNLLNGTINLSDQERNFLNSLSKFDNIPRRKGKFLNFVYNILNNRVNRLIVESVWDKMETAHKQNLQTTTKIQEQDNVNKANGIKSNANSDNDYQECVAENQNNENICIENSVEHQNGNSEAYEANGNKDDTQTVTRKESRKRRMTMSIKTEEEEPPAKIKKTPILLEINSSENETKKVTFDWKKTILDIIHAKGEISLKKLQKKVVSQYMNHRSNNIEYEKAVAKFNKRFKKLSEISITENTVKFLDK